MGLFSFLGSENDEQKAARLRNEDSQRRIEAGGLPLHATERLQEARARQNTPQHFWSSDLSVGELSLVRQAGFQPLGQVMGSSVYHVGFNWQSATWSNSYFNGGGASMEFQVLTQAFYNARHLSLGRLAQEAQMLGATGVVGVRLKRDNFGFSNDMLEFSAIGTAIREENAAPGAPFFLSELSGEDFWKLRAAGFRPVGVAVGNCTYYQVPTWNTQNVMQGGWLGGGSWQNVELPDYTQALYTARELAMNRMEAEAQQVKASGIVSVTVEMDAEPHHVEVNNQTRIDMLYHFTAIGTAIAPFAHATQPLAVNLNISLRADWENAKKNRPPN
jgi:uncharacterized protein YbjQ (UPF0145 family)